MKKLNVICASIAALCSIVATSANAGQLTGGTTFATENFGPTATDAVTITPGAVTYSMTTITAVNPNATIYFVIRLNGGKFADGLDPAAADFSFAGVTPNGATADTPTATITVSADRTTAQVRVVNGNTTSRNLGLGALVWTPAAGAIDSVASNLGSAGGKVDATVVVTTAATTLANLESSVALPTTLDAPAPTTAIATSATAIASTVSALPTYTGKIDLTANPVASTYKTTAGVALANVALGSVKFKVTAGRKQVNGTTDYDLEIGTDHTGSIEVTPGAGQAFPIGAKLFADKTDSSCGAEIAGTATAAFTAETSTKKATLTIAANDITTDVPVYVCMSEPSTGNTAAPITASIVGKAIPATATHATSTATGTGYALDYNGSTVEVTSYWPGALAVYQYKGYLKITNTGSVSAAITGQHRDTNGALVGSAKVLTVPGKLATGVLAAGQSVLLSSEEIDAVLGANPAGAQQGRIRITAPTNKLQIQSLLQTGADAPIEYSTSSGI